MTKRRILIVNEDAGAAAHLSGRLAALGYEPIVTAAPEHSAGTLPDLILVTPQLEEAVRTLPPAYPGERRMPPVLLVTAAQAEGEIPGPARPPLAFGTETEGDAAGPAPGAPAADVVVTDGSDRELRLAVELALARTDAAHAAHELERFFDVSSDMFCFLDFGGYFKRLNPAWERTLGFTRRELMSRPFIEFVHPEDRERTLAQNATVRQGVRTEGFENRYMCKDGSFRWLLWNAAPISARKVIHSVARDITARKEAEAERTELVRELEASLAEVRRLQTILPICSYCRHIRDDSNYWHSVEDYISRHTDSQFSHSICPSCMETVVAAEMRDFEEG